MTGGGAVSWDVVALEVATIPGLPRGQFVPAADPGDLADPADPGDGIDIACLAFVLIGPDRVIVVDPGPDLERARVQGFELVAGRTSLVDGLRDLGVTPADVDTVVLTHLHYDHAQSSSAFPRARIAVQRAELAHAEGRPDRFYTDLPARSDAALVLLDGDSLVAPGVVAIHTGGHSNGHQAVLVDTVEGPVCLAGDEIPLLANLAVCPPSTSDPAGWQRLVDRANAGQWLLVPSHDAELATFRGAVRRVCRVHHVVGRPAGGRAMTPVRVAVLGAGYWAVVNHLPVLHARPDVQVVAVCGRGPELDDVAAAFGAQIATDDPEVALAADLDAVVIATPNSLHHPMALDCLDRGLDILLEKPVAITAAHAWELVDRARERVAVVAYGWNFAPVVEAARAAVSDGEIGEVQSFLCHMASPTLGLFSGQGGYGPAPAVGPARPEPATWTAVEHGGGYAFGQLTHALGLLFWITDLDPAEVWARTAAGSGDVDLLDAGVLTLANGAIGTVSGAGNLPDHASYQVDVRVTGSRGALLLDIAGGRFEVVRHDGPTRSVTIRPEDRVYDGRRPVERFIDLIRGESTVNCSPLSCGARAVSVVDAMLRSARTGRPESCVVTDR